jgi:threonine/homoserine/homoserine lactone efflux protein
MMSQTILELLPLILGSVIAPFEIIIILLFLKNQQSGLDKALLFLLGVTTTRLVQGIIFGLILNPGASADSANGKGPVISMLLLLLGILLLNKAYKIINKRPDPEDDPPKWMATIESATAAKAYALGMQIPLINTKMWVFTLGAISTISYAQLALPISIYTYLIFIVLVQTLLILPLLLRVLLPKQSITIVQAASAWLAKNNRTILIVILLVFGVYFFYQGFSGFLMN